jgi:hypothetical protein
MIRPSAPLFLLFLLGSACDSTGPAASLGRTPDSTGTESVPPPTPPDTTTPPGPDSLPPPPPPDTVAPPPGDTTSPVLPPYTPKHSGIPFGPAQQPSGTFGPELQATILPGNPAELLIDLERARRSDTRVLINFSGHTIHLQDANGFSMANWKARVDRFKGMDLTSYLEDGTIIGHFLLDEPSDPNNWGGDKVSPAEIEEMGRHSKERWPTMITIVRAWPDYMEGYRFQHVDAIRFHYLHRLGPLDPWIEEHFREARSLGLAIVSGLNVLNGGGPNSGIPGRKEGKFAMNAAELREWGKRLLAEDICAFFLWEWDPGYQSRPEIKEALADLKRIAEDKPKRLCRP